METTRVPCAACAGTGVGGSRDGMRYCLTCNGRGYDEVAFEVPSERPASGVRIDVLDGCSGGNGGVGQSGAMGFGAALGEGEYGPPRYRPDTTIVWLKRNGEGFVFAPMRVVEMLERQRDQIASLQMAVAAIERRQMPLIQGESQPDGILLKGWNCGACYAFNGEEKDTAPQWASCRACGRARSVTNGAKLTDAGRALEGIAKDLEGIQRRILDHVEDTTTGEPVWENSLSALKDIAVSLGDCAVACSVAARTALR